MKKCTCPACGHTHGRMAKATDDAEQERASERGLRGLQEAADALRDDVAHERAERRGKRVEKAYTAEERRDVRAKKTEEYGRGETFAVPSLRSYPLTDGGKPSEERTMAAWRYINVPENAAKLGEKGAAAKRRIRAFAKKHFGKDLEAGEEAKKAMAAETPAQDPALPADEVYALQDRSLWPMTKGLQPDAGLIRAAASALHEACDPYSQRKVRLARASGAQDVRTATLTDEEAEVAAARIAHFARHHGIAI